MQRFITDAGNQVFPRRVLSEHPFQQFGIKRTGIDPMRTALSRSRQWRKSPRMCVPFRAFAHVSRIDPVLVQCLCALGVVPKQFVTVIMKVSDERGADSRVPQAEFYFRHGDAARGVLTVTRHHFRTGFRKRDSLRRRCFNVRRVGIGHGLDHDRGVTADANTSSLNGYCFFSGHMDFRLTYCRNFAFTGILYRNGAAGCSMAPLIPANGFAKCRPLPNATAALRRTELVPPRATGKHTDDKCVFF
jgi:hypothetical protein